MYVRIFLVIMLVRIVSCHLNLMLLIAFSIYVLLLLTISRTHFGNLFMMQTAFISCHVFFIFFMLVTIVKKNDSDEFVYQ